LAGKRFIKVGEVEKSIVVPVVGRCGAKAAPFYLAYASGWRLCQENHAEREVGVLHVTHSCEGFCKFHAAKVDITLKPPKDSLSAYNIYGILLHRLKRKYF